MKELDSNFAAIDNGTFFQTLNRAESHGRQHTLLSTIQEQ